MSLAVEKDLRNALLRKELTVPDKLILRFTKTRERRAEEEFAVDVMT